MRTNQKLVCYLVLAVLTSFVSQADKMSAETVRSYIWWDWMKFVGAIFVSAGLVWRAYVDQSLSREAAEGKAAGSGGAVAGVMILAGLAALLLGCAGCATVTQTAKTETVNPTNGVVTTTTASSRITAWGDAKNVVDKVRASAGKTSSVGASGVSEETTSQGVQNIIGLLVQAAMELGKTQASGGAVK